jgi:hypothetical protein
MQPLTAGGASQRLRPAASLCARGASVPNARVATVLLMPTDAEVRAKTRDEKARKLLAAWRKEGGFESEANTLSDFLLARLIVAIESLEERLDR